MGKPVVDANDFATPIAGLERYGADRAVDSRRRTAADDNANAG